jgi:hypothetical protein
MWGQVGSQVWEGKSRRRHPSNSKPQTPDRGTATKPLQYHLPPLSKKLVYSANRGELDLPARFNEPCDSGPSARLLPAQPAGRRRGDDQEQRLQNQRRDQ